MIRRCLLLLVSISFLFAGISASAEKLTSTEGIETFPGLKALHLKNEDVTLYYNPKISIASVDANNAVYSHT